jgi:DNA polymerase-3 subunit epsilon
MEAAIFSSGVEQIVFAALDVETTGLNPYLGDRICEIAVLRFRGPDVLEPFSSLVNPGRHIAQDASAVSGITDEMVRAAPPFDDVAPHVLRLLEGAVLLAHNAPFDLAFLAVQLASLGYPQLTNPVVDTLALARRCYQYPSNALGDLARARSLSGPREHRAAGDAELTRRLFRSFLSDFSAKDACTLGDVLSLQGGNVSIPSPDQPELPPFLQEAIDEGRKLRIRYRSAEDVWTERVVIPLQVNSQAGKTYLIARCDLRGEERTFRLDRIEQMLTEPD